MNHPAVQLLPAALIDMDRLQVMQAEALEARDLRVQMKELQDQKSDLEAEKEGLAKDKEGLKRYLEDAKQRILALQALSQDHRKKEERLERKAKRLHETQAPLSLFTDFIAPLLELESVIPPGTIEVEVRRPSPRTPNYDLLEKYDIDTVTKKKIVKKPCLASQTSKPFTLRITCLGHNAEFNKGEIVGGDRVMKRIKV